jgi:hypothetical protein
MMEGPLSGRNIFRLSVLGLAITSGFGALALSAFEDLSLADGLWMCFTVITTIGFGEGPTTGGGRLVSAGAFLVAAACWFGLISVSVEVGLARYQRNALLSQALEPLVRRRGPRLFDRN